MLDSNAVVTSLILFSIIAIFLNSLCLYIVKTTYKKDKASSWLLINLLVVHLFQGVVVLPFYLGKKLYICNILWAQVFANGFRFTHMLSFYGNCLGVLSISVDRFLAARLLTCYKIVVTKKTVERYLIILWLYIIGLCIVPFFNFQKGQSDLGSYDLLITPNGTCHENPFTPVQSDTCRAYSPGVTLYYYTPPKDWVIFMLSCNAAIPYFLIISCYLYIIIRLRNIAVNQKTPLKTVRNALGLLQGKIIYIQQKDILRYKRLKYLTFLITITYGLFWSPSIIYYLLIDICGKCFPCNFNGSVLEQYVGYVVKYLAFSNSAAAPALYCFFHSEFRKSFWKLKNKIKCWSISNTRRNTPSELSLDILG